MLIIHGENPSFAYMDRAMYKHPVNVWLNMTSGMQSHHTITPHHHHTSCVCIPHKI